MAVLDSKATEFENENTGLAAFFTLTENLQKLGRKYLIVLS